ncbi:C6 finger domain protein [Penicillium atrosanguineum]|nr:C6 finger domain protein [Penicillium atrosanguineum]
MTYRNETSRYEDSQPLARNASAGGQGSGIPCLECTKRDVVCIFDESSDKRRKSYSSKMEQDLTFYQELMDDFFELIRISSDDDVHHMINIVRSGSSAGEIQTEVVRVLANNNYLRPTA